MADGIRANSPRGTATAAIWKRSASQFAALRAAPERARAAFGGDPAGECRRMGKADRGLCHFV